MSDLKKPILCLDFDGVIHSYTSGWKGAGAIPDPPVPGAIQFIAEAVETFEVHIFSSRSGQPDGIDAMRLWLRLHMLALMSNAAAELLMHKINFPTEKPPALVTLDDRAVTFTGEWPDLEALANFKPWNKQ